MDGRQISKCVFLHLNESGTAGGMAGRKQKQAKDKKVRIEEQYLTKRTRQQHGKWKELLLLLTTDDDKAARKCIDTLERMRKENKWRWSTTATQLGRLMGAMARCGRERLKAHWRLRDYRRLAELEVHKEAAAARAVAYGKATVQQVLDLVSDEAKLFGIFMWATAARPSDVERIRTEHVQWNGAQLTIRYVEGKGVKARSAPYTVHTVVPQRWASLAALISRTREFVFARETAVRCRNEIRHQLKQLGLPADLRGFRRGALQAMSGCDEAVVRQFSNHASKRQLDRYLKYGWLNRKDAKNMRSAAKNLWDCSRSY